MNIKRALGKERQREDSDVNIIPVMNIFLLLIPFLLLTAAFVRIAIIDLSLPSLNKGNKVTQQQEQKPLVFVILAIKEDAIQVKSPGFKFDPVERQKDSYNFQKLVTQLKELKEKNATAEDIILTPEATIKYDIIIKVMDRCRETGFPNVSLG